MSATQSYQPLWLPWYFNALANRKNPGHAWIHGYVRLPGWHFLSWNMEPDAEERIVWSLGSLVLTRPETAEEKEEREEGEAQAWAEVVEANRYTPWSY